ncbi:sigma-70 family RNA polymerase sigma factor [Tychonema sp. LEGE 07199]|uniref:RNA polymerase sigma factor n=1 Tax=unclassified Tychonema TaxID=2642144 RepID=UPI001880558E|nr:MULTISPECIES: sigma-70 family RNA polymerase sigma factor [unclassified Tychonema]MBE9122309.1 sigma-70 family RNA polymerase sigma factor [Tychonema sp. LEGE 07199]MBE9130308.1 sigma-70 family RNA polymerase sigma factor [Tychonema sp. LEGE 07196]
MLSCSSAPIPCSCTPDIDSAFWKLWQDNQDYLYRCCRKWMGNPTDAEDALSRAMLKAWEKARDGKGDIKNFKAWLTKLTYNLCADIHRERNRSAVGVDSLDTIALGNETELISQEETPVRAAMERELELFFSAAIDELPDRLRETFILHFESGLSYQDIAEQLGISYDNVRKRISQARGILRQRFNENFGEDGTDSDFSNPKSRVSPQSAKGKKSQNIVEKKIVKEEIETREILGDGVQEPVLVNAQSDGEIGEIEIVAGDGVPQAAACVLHLGAKDYSPLQILANSLGNDSEKAIAPNANSRLLSESWESQKALAVGAALMVPPRQAVVLPASAIRCIPSFSTPENPYLPEMRSRQMRSRQGARGISRNGASCVSPFLLYRRMWADSGGGLLSSI